jgi:hypothetical protein
MVNDGILSGGKLITVKYKTYTHGYQGKKNGIDIVLLHDGSYLKNEGDGWKFVEKKSDNPQFQEQLTAKIEQLMNQQ